MAANPADTGVYHFRSRVRFTLDRKYFGDLIDTLSEQTKTIRQIVDGLAILHNQKEMHITESSRQLADRSRINLDLVRSLFTAIERGCRPGCHKSHEAMILLDNILALDAWRSQGSSNKQADGAAFEIYFATTDQLTDEVHCQKMVVQAEGKTTHQSRATSS